MTKKITLTIEQELLTKAKLYAEQEGQSLSNLVSNYLKQVTRQKSKDKANQISEIDKMFGAFKLPEYNELDVLYNGDYKAYLGDKKYEDYMKKYL